MGTVIFSNLVLLFTIALVAGTVDAMAGGGGLLNLPALLMVGLNPTSALATNKLQGIFSALSATVHFWRKGKIRLKDHIAPALAGFLSGTCGAILVSFINPDALKTAIPFLLIGIAIWMLCSPQLGTVERKARLSPFAYALTIVPLIGFYDGFFGPGTGTFFAMANVFFLGLRLEEATFRAKIYNFTSNLGAALSFVLSAHIAWLYVLVMIIGTLIGGNIGARLVIRHGTALIKPALVIMSVVMSLRLLWQQEFVQRLLGF